MNITEKLAQEFGLRLTAVEQTIALIDEGNTIPFIARYRKEMTGGLSDVVLRDIDVRLKYLRGLEERKEEVKKLIDEQGKLTPELAEAIEKAEILQRVEDLYKPFKQKKNTRASKAKEKGLEPLADLIWAQEQESGDLLGDAVAYINEETEVETAEDALAGACDILAERISDDPDITEKIRTLTRQTGILVSEAVDPDEMTVYEMYYEYSEPVSKIPNHRVLALNRGEKEKKLKVKLKVDDEAVIEKILTEIIRNEKSISLPLLTDTASDAYKRLMAPSIEREIRGELTERAEKEAVKVFAKNTENLLMAPPVRDAKVLSIDPGYRTGCKVAALSETGKLLAYATIYPTEPKNDIEGAERIITKLIDKFNLNTIVIGNGTASRETERFIADYISKTGRDIRYTIVSEAGASVYSASKLASEEYPDLDVTTRGAMSIGRRLQDPLAELVKISPKHIGVGQYQHDISQSLLDEALTNVVEDCVNRVGVDLNTASPSLLSYISGINSGIARNIVSYRETNGVFTNRNQLLNVPKLGEKTFKQCAGFMRIRDGEEPLDSTAVHPESYQITEEMLSRLELEKGVISAGGAESIEDRIREKYAPVEEQQGQSALHQEETDAKAGESAGGTSGTSAAESGTEYSGKHEKDGRKTEQGGRSVKNTDRGNGSMSGSSAGGKHGGKMHPRQLPANGLAALAVLLEDDEFMGRNNKKKKPAPRDRGEEHRRKLEEQKRRQEEKRVRQAQLKQGIERMAEDLGIGAMTLTDIVAEIRKPARDPRESMPPVIFRQDVLSFEDLKPDMELTGTVRNVVDFGAFVDIGVKTDGLVHISQLSRNFVSHPMDVVSVGDIVKVRVLEVDQEKHKIALTMKF